MNVPNPFKVSSAGRGTIVILKPPKADEAGVEPRITGDEALNLAAWLMACAGPEVCKKLPELVEKIRTT